MFEIIIVICFIIYGIYVVFMYHIAMKIKDPLYRFLFEVGVQMFPWGLLFIVYTIMK